MWFAVNRSRIAACDQVSRSVASLNLVSRTLGVAAAIIAAGGLAACSDRNGAQAQASKAPTSVPVLVAQAVEKRVPMRLHAIGNVETIASVAVKARVDGQILRVHVRDGQDVAAGDLLFQIDPNPYQSQLEQALANLAQDQAQL